MGNCTNVNCANVQYVKIPYGGKLFKLRDDKINNFKMIDIIGQGGFGKVFKFKIGLESDR